MQYLWTLLALSPVGLAQLQITDSVGASVLQVLATAIPPESISKATADPDAFQSELESSLSAGLTPEWYQALPSDVKSYLPQLYPVETSAETTTSSTLPHTVKSTNAIKSSSSRAPPGVSTRLSASMSASASPTTINTPSNIGVGGGPSGGLSVGAKAGIGIGSTFCALLAILILVILFRRKTRPNTHQPTAQSGDLPELALNIHSGNGLYGPPLVQQNTPSHPERLGASYRNGDVGYTNEKRTPAATESREEVRGYIELDVPNHASPIALTSRIVSVIETSEVQGSLPPKRHELGNNE